MRKINVTAIGFGIYTHTYSMEQNARRRGQEITFVGIRRRAVRYAASRGHVIRELALGTVSESSRGTRKAKERKERERERERENFEKSHFSEVAVHARRYFTVMYIGIIRITLECLECYNLYLYMCVVREKKSQKLGDAGMCAGFCM